MIAASAPIDRIDIAFIICFLVHKGSGRSSSQALSETNRNQDPCVLSGKFSANKLIVMKKAASRTFPLAQSVNSTFIDWGIST
jgi:hypothetical protein